MSADSATVTSIATLEKDSGSFFCINAYPFQSYIADPTGINLDYALLKTSHTVNGVTYANMLAAQVAAVRAALLAADPALTADALPIVVGETGWPTSGNTYATTANAETYANNAVAAGIDLYLFSAFDEELKSEQTTNRRAARPTARGEAYEDFWGVFSESGSLKYTITALEGTRTAFSPDPSPSPDDGSNAAWWGLLGLLGLIPLALLGVCACRRGSRRGQRDRSGGRRDTRSARDREWDRRESGGAASVPPSVTIHSMHSKTPPPTPPTPPYEGYAFP